MATLSLNNLRKTYPSGVDALHGINLEINDGELIVVVGPSGCGKSTLLRMIAGLEEISAGELKIDGTRVNDKEPAARDIAMVFQNYALYPHMNVYANMAYSLKNRGMARAEIERQVTATTRLLGIEALLERRPRQLSGGQRQRVAMGRAIVRQPRVFLFDEPLSNLDAKLRVQMRLEIKKLQKRLGVTSIYVTHDQTEAMTLADRLVVMNGGRVEQVGTPLELFDRPATRFVAGFIGSPAMNFIDVTADGRALWLPDGTRIPCPGVPSGALTLGVRPEHLSVSQTPDAHLHGHVKLIEPLGAYSLIYTQVLEQHNPLVACINGRANVTVGQGLALNISGSFHIFNKDGQRIDVEPTLVPVSIPSQA